MTCKCQAIIYGSNVPALIDKRLCNFKAEIEEKILL